MDTIDSGIVFDFPANWEQFTDGGRCVFHTPRHEEIIVSATRVSGGEPVVAQVFANGLEAARRGASHPDLRVTKPLAEDSDVSGFHCATVLAETMTRDAFFGQAVLQHAHGVIFLTYEAPFVDGAEQAFRDLLRMIYEDRPAA